MDFTRREYHDTSFNREDLHATPLEQLRAWMQKAIDSKVFEPNAGVLATATPEGSPSSRVVLMKEIREKSVVFYTSHKSRKACELHLNPRASFTIWWKELERQVTLAGHVQTLTQSASELYWQTRPRGSQLGAWASQQSAVIPSRQVLEERLKEMRERFEGRDIPLPSFWGGYELIVERAEFWQGRRDRLHDRFQYTLSLDGVLWRIERLSP